MLIHRSRCSYRPGSSITLNPFCEGLDLQTLDGRDTTWALLPLNMLNLIHDAKAISLPRDATIIVE